MKLVSYGTIAHVFSTYETRETKNGPVTNRGVNSIQLFLIKTGTISLMCFGVQRVWVLRYPLLDYNSLILYKGNLITEGYCFEW